MLSFANRHRFHLQVLFAALLCTATQSVERGSEKFVLPTANISEDDASYYIFRDDVVLFPISYSIPKEYILSSVPEKTAFAVNDTKSFQIKHYRYGPLQEEGYHQNIQKHRFGDTRRKGGYDCLRHYELLANGCVPILAGLDNVPRSVMTTLPRPLLKEAQELFHLPWEGIQDGAAHCPSAAPEAYDVLAAKLLDYTAGELSTESTARYILDTLHLGEDSKVLFLACSAIDNFPSYLTASVFHGLVSILGDNVIDVPEYDYAYRFDSSTPPEVEEKVRGNLWGQGFTLGFRLPPRPHLFRGNISERIRALEFDLIVFARMSPYEPCNFAGEFKGRGSTVPMYFGDVIDTYPRERVALLYGDDSGLDDAVIRTSLRRMGALHRGLGMVFMREMLPFVSEGPPGETLRPVDGRIIQPGCFYSEWMEFFSLWQGAEWQNGTSNLLECAARGFCSSLRLDEYLASASFNRLIPPLDRAVRKQFCGTGYTLKAALLVQSLGPDACGDDEHCQEVCQGALSVYGDLLHDAPSNNFFEEFGMTPSEVMYMMNQGCGGAAVGMQPAVAEKSKDVFIVVDGPPLSAGSGPLAGEWQARYYLRQGYNLHVLCSDYSDEDQVPPRMHNALYSGDLMVRLLPSTSPYEHDSGHLLHEAYPCGWMSLEDGNVPLLIHFDLSRGPAAAAALGCLVHGKKSLRPKFTSLQMPVLSASIAWRAIATLLAAGYSGFKVSHLSPQGLGSLFGDLAVDAASITDWRSSDEVLASGALVPGVQLHAIRS